MPTYGYQCNDCKHEFSVFQPMKDDPISICPECTGSVKRLLYPVGIVFKGSGWYINDSRKPEKAEGSGEKNGEKADASKTDGSSDSTKSDTAKSETTKSENGKSETSGDKSSDKSKPAPATASASSDK